MGEGGSYFFGKLAANLHKEQGRNLRVLPKVDHLMYELDLPHIQARIRRHRQLAAGLSTELVQHGIDSEPLTREELRAYLAGITDMAKGADDAEAVLRKAVERLGTR